MRLGNEQSEAAELINEWFDSDEQYFYLAGYAGTGKSFLIQHMIQQLGLQDDEVCFVTPTGKSATVLISRGTSARTVFQLIYNVRIEEVKKIVADKEIILEKLIFEKKEELDKDYKLIILDEFSMISNRVFEDLLSFGIKVLCCGDKGQLAPVGGSNKYIDEPNYTLTEIFRQKNGDSIIEFATKARNGNYLYPGEYGNVHIIRRSTLTDDDIFELMKYCDQTICGTNATRKTLNNLYRMKSGIDVTEELLPLEGEKVIATFNNWKLTVDKNKNINLVNGLIGYSEKKAVFENEKRTLASFTFKPDFTEGTNEKIVFDAGQFTQGQDYFDQGALYVSKDDGTLLPIYEIEKEMKKLDKEARLHPKNLEMYREQILELNFAKKETKVINKFEFAYAISCHKSQGSEFDKLLVFDESRFFSKERSKWLYTAITRAKKELFILV